MRDEASTPGGNGHLGALRSTDNSNTAMKEPPMPTNKSVQGERFSSYDSMETDEPATKRCRGPSPRDQPNGRHHDCGMGVHERHTAAAISDSAKQSQVEPGHDSNSRNPLWCFLCQSYRDKDKFSLEEQRLGNACGKFAFCRMHSAKERRMKHFSRIAMGFQDPGNDANGSPLVDRRKLMLAEYDAMVRSGEAMNSDGEFVREDAEEGEIADDDSDDDGAHKDDDESMFISESDFQQMVYKKNQQSVIDFTHDDSDSDDLCDTNEKGEIGPVKTTVAKKNKSGMRGYRCQQQQKTPHQRTQIEVRGERDTLFGNSKGLRDVPPAQGLAGDRSPDREDAPAAPQLQLVCQATPVACTKNKCTHNSKQDDDDDDVARIMLNLQKKPSRMTATM